jgi:hypothetical protein
LLYLLLSGYCLCVNVCCTTATRCQPNCSWQIYHLIIKVAKALRRPKSRGVSKKNF